MKFSLVALLMALVLCVPGCAAIFGPSQRELAVLSSNIAVGLLADMQKREEMNCVADAQTRTQAQLCIAAVELRWQVVWTAWASVRNSDDPLTAFCKFRNDMDKSGFKIPDNYHLCK